MRDQVIYKSDVFVDFTDKERQFVFAAVIKNIHSEPSVLLEEISFGVSVQNPIDERNTELGKIIAKGKATKQRSRLGVMYTSGKIINSKTIELILSQKVEYFKINPGFYIKGYQKDEELYSKSPENYLKKFKK